MSDNMIRYTCLCGRTSTFDGSVDFTCDCGKVRRGRPLPGSAPVVAPHPPKPTVGRIVHYYEPHLRVDTIGEPLAAIIVAVLAESGAVSLHVFLDQETIKGRGKTRHVRWASFSAEPKGGCWTWPPRS